MAMNEEIIDNVFEAANAPTITKSEAIYKFSNLTIDELATKVQTFLLNKGYKLEEGTTLEGKYGKGNRILRILFGAFVKRFAWQVTVEPEGKMSKLTFFKGTKGYAGGAIGVSQVNNEYKSITASLTAFHLGQEGTKNEEE